MYKPCGWIWFEELATVLAVEKNAAMICGVCIRINCVSSSSTTTWWQWRNPYFYNCIFPQVLVYNGPPGWSWACTCSVSLATLSSWIRVLRLQSACFRKCLKRTIPAWNMDAFKRAYKIFRKLTCSACNETSRRWEFAGEMLLDAIYNKWSCFARIGLMKQVWCLKKIDNQWGLGKINRCKTHIRKYSSWYYTALCSTIHHTPLDGDSI